MRRSGSNSRMVRLPRDSLQTEDASTAREARANSLLQFLGKRVEARAIMNVRIQELVIELEELGMSQDIIYRALHPDGGSKS